MSYGVPHSLRSGSPFCIYAQNDQINLFVGDIQHHDYLAHLPRTSDHGMLGHPPIASISMVPFSQLKERDFEVVNEGEKIICLVPTSHCLLTKEQLVSLFDCNSEVRVQGELTYNFSDGEFRDLVEKVIRNEIQNGAGSNFLISRKASGSLGGMEVDQALTIFYRLLNNEFGSYMTFCFFDGARYFIGASPEKHLTIKDGTACMGPICGTLTKTHSDMPAALREFIKDEKEINELFMVVDETLKMMMPLCPDGGEVSGPFLREMSTLIHTENELRGKTHWDPIDAFRATLFAPTMVGSPVESASRVIYKYEKGHSRRYYSSAILILGDESQSQPYLDSAITIRTIEISSSGDFTIQAGASIVRDSVPEREVVEVKAKSLGLLRAISCEAIESPMLHKISDADIEKLLLRRNERLSTFWIKTQGNHSVSSGVAGKKIVLINNEDDFVHMAAHLLERMGAIVTTKDIKRLGGLSSLGGADIVILGPGPGDPMDINDPKMRKLHKLTEELFQTAKHKLYGICLGHQIICRQLGLPLVKLPVPCQGVQKEVDVFGISHQLGFYNTFSAQLSASLPSGVELCADSDGFVNFTRGAFFGSTQAHLESILSKDGYELLLSELSRLFYVAG